jgi:hypothetical protein
MKLLQRRKIKGKKIRKGVVVLMVLGPLVWGVGVSLSPGTKGPFSIGSITWY